MSARRPSDATAPPASNRLKAVLQAGLQQAPLGASLWTRRLGVYQRPSVAEMRARGVTYRELVIYMLTSGVNISLLEVCQAYEQLVPFEPNPNFDRLNESKSRKQLGFDFKRLHDDGVPFGLARMFAKWPLPFDMQGTLEAAEAGYDVSDHYQGFLVNNDDTYYFGYAYLLSGQPVPPNSSDAPTDGSRREAGAAAYIVKRLLELPGGDVLRKTLEKERQEREKAREQRRQKLPNDGLLNVPQLLPEGFLNTIPGE